MRSFYVYKLISTLISIDLPTSRGRQICVFVAGAFLIIIVEALVKMKFFTLLMLIVSASLFVSCQQQDANNSYTLHLGVFLSVNSTEFSTIGFLPALDIAIETVNNHSEILKNLNGTSYYLNVIFNDSRVSRTDCIVLTLYERVKSCWIEQQLSIKFNIFILVCSL